jgi:hypothetical protein
VRSGSEREAKYPEPISKGQIAVIKIAQKELGIEDDDYRSMLIAHFKVSSCTQLTKAQATRLIERFEALGFETRNKTPRARGSHPGYVRIRKPQQRLDREDGKLVRLASFEERGKIDALAALIDWEFKDGLKRWMEKRLKIDRVRTSREAYLVIEGLKKMFAIRMAKLHGDDWWTKKFDNTGIMRFIKEHAPGRSDRQPGCRLAKSPPAKDVVGPSGESGN